MLITEKEKLALIGPGNVGARNHEGNGYLWVWTLGSGRYMLMETMFMNSLKDPVPDGWHRFRWLRFREVPDPRKDIIATYGDIIVMKGTL